MLHFAIFFGFKYFPHLYQLETIFRLYRTIGKSYRYFLLLKSLKMLWLAAFSENFISFYSTLTAFWLCFCGFLCLQFT